jgi:enolase-phosphatase E1
MILSLSSENITAILLDIEGTTTPIAFVHDVLFPFARAGVRAYLEKHFDQTVVQEDLARLREEHGADVSQHLTPPALSNASVAATIDSLATYLYWLMDQDRKTTALKSLQGKIWQQGYAEGRLKSLVFADVPPALERWHNAGLNVSIFSSGSILAQQLLFAHTEAGDLTRFLSRYFDTTTGPKSTGESYCRIAAELERAPHQVLFVSDVVAELDAARLAGLKTLLCIRPGNHPQTENTHLSIQTFAEITE